MFIGKKSHNRKKEQKGQFDFSPAKPKEEERKKIEAPETHLELEAPHDSLIEEFSEDVLFHWKGPEFEILERDKKWYLLIFVILFLIVGYAIYINGIIMAITFILIGAVGYIYINKEPQILNFMITEQGVFAGRDIYEFENLDSFWIFYEADEKGFLVLHTKSYLAPFVHIPIHRQDPVKIREILLDFIPEEKKDWSLWEALNRLLKL